MLSSSSEHHETTYLSQRATIALVAYLLYTGVITVSNWREHQRAVTSDRLALLLDQRATHDATITQLKRTIQDRWMEVKVEGKDPSVDSMFIADKQLLLHEEQQRDSLLQLIRRLEMGI